MGIGVFYSDEQKLNEIYNLLNKIQFTNQNINEYNRLLQDYNIIQKQYTDIENKFSTDNLDKNIRTINNRNILINVQKININDTFYQNLNNYI